MSFIENLQDVIWTSPTGKTFTIKTQECGYKRKHIGEVKENPKTTKSASTSTKSGGGSKSKTSSSSSVSTTQSTKRVQDSNDTFTDMGVGGRDVSLDCYFVGVNHYTQAEAFANALCEVGKSKLQLAYGQPFTVNVIDFGLTNSLIERINVTIVQVNWHETAKDSFPTSEKSKTKQIKNLAEEAKTNVAESFQEAFEQISNPSRLQNFINSFSSGLDKVSEYMDTANNVSLNSIMSDLKGQNLGIANAFTMASQLGVVLTKAASLTNRVKNVGSSFTLTAGLGNYFSGWSGLISNLISSSKATSSSGTLTPEEIDNIIINDCTATFAVVAVAETLIDSEFETRAEAVEAAKNLKDLQTQWTNFVDEQFKKIDKIEEYYIRDNSSIDVVTNSANEILERSYKLKVEKRIVLSEDCSVVDLAYKYYNDAFRENPDETIDYLIKSNGFVDNEFFLLKRGTEIKIYV